MAELLRKMHRTG